MQLGHRESSLDSLMARTDHDGKDETRCVLSFVLRGKVGDTTSAGRLPLVGRVGMATDRAGQHCELGQVMSNSLRLSSGALKAACIIIKIRPAWKRRFHRVLPMPATPRVLAESPAACLVHSLLQC